MLRSRTLHAIIASLVAILLALATSIALKLPVPEFLQPFAWPAVAVLIAITLALVVWERRLGNTSEPAISDARAKRNRSRMIERVRSFWIKGVLEKSLHHEVRLALGLEEKPEAVNHDPWDLIVQQPDHAPRQLPAGTEIINLFEELDRALLILGGPGSGKTTMLLELARDLLIRAEWDDVQPIPVVFNLSSWAVKREALADWLVDELNERYDVPRKLAKAWVLAEQILPLLDGLDEVALEHRAACVDAINAFWEQHGLLPLAVCSREADYEALTTRLRLHGAIVIRPLTPKQVDDYLEVVGKHLKGVRTALQGDTVLRELLDTPLMLSVATLAYQGRSLSEVRLSEKGTLEEHRTRLFETYAEAMFQRRGEITSYTRQQIFHWLAWLARSLAQHDQSVFYLERMQPSCLATRAHRRLVNLGATVSSGLVFGLAGGLIAGLLGGLDFGLVVGLGLGLFGVVAGQVKGEEGIRPAETLGLSWSSMWEWLRGWLYGGPVVGLVVALVWGTEAGLLVGFFVVLVFGLLGGLVIGLAGLLDVGEITTRTVPNEGMRRSIRNGLVAGLVVALVVALVFGLAAGLVIGLVFGWWVGGYAYSQHLILRILLRRNGFAPWNYVQFLDFAAERIFLRKVGGGYIFVHRLLLEYFASLEPEAAAVSR